MTQQGPRKLQRFASGGVSRNAAIFGEAGPEAAVPLADSRSIPVDLRLPTHLQIPAAARFNAPTANVSASLSPTYNITMAQGEGGGVTQDQLAAVLGLSNEELLKAVRRALPSMLVDARNRDFRLGRLFR